MRNRPRDRETETETERNRKRVSGFSSALLVAKFILLQLLVGEDLRETLLTLLREILIASSFTVAS